MLRKKTVTAETNYPLKQPNVALKLYISVNTANNVVGKGHKKI